MSAPTPAPGDDRPREGYYPDPSIPGYVRYWNGAAWVPGTSRPAPTDGEPLAAPPGAGPASGAAPTPAPVEETGPHFFDEDPVPETGPSAGSPSSTASPSSAVSDAQHGSRPEPASAWGADRSQQSGFGGDQDRRVSWGAPQPADPRLPAESPSQPEGRSSSTDGTATIPPAEPDSRGTYVFRRPQGTPGEGEAAGQGTPGPARDEGTVTFRALSPRTGQQNRGDGAQPGSTGPEGSSGAGSGSGSGGPGFGAGKDAAARAAAAQGQGQAQGQAGAQASPSIPAARSGPQQAPTPAVPHQSEPPATPASSAPVPTPMTAGPGGGQPSWAQQVHRLAGGTDDQPVAPWKPPVEDLFQAAARRQAEARPAGLGKRLVARLLDTVVLLGVTGVAAVPLGTKAIDHVNEKIDAAKLSGETVTVWLLDGTTSVYLGIVLAVLLGFGLVYEALPTAKWGRTLGKKLLGLEVRDIEAHEPPTFGAALRRWLVYSVPGLLGIGVLGVLWCLFDRPWHQCWHDKAARTFVAG